MYSEWAETNNIGKSTLAEALVETLASESYGLKAYVSSLDGVYTQSARLL